MTRGGEAAAQHEPVAVGPLVRCAWAASELGIRYHDEEWGVPVHNDRTLFEFLVLEGAQAGLSWDTILRKRDGYRAAFDNFDATAVAQYGPQETERLLTNPGIVRNRAKIAAAIVNARALLVAQQEFGSFDALVWQYAGGGPRTNSWSTHAEIPASSLEAGIMSRDLKRRGFAFVGPTICYAFMQATGMVNDHTLGCFRHVELQRRSAAATPRAR